MCIFTLETLESIQYRYKMGISKDFSKLPSIFTNRLYIKHTKHITCNTHSNLWTNLAVYKMWPMTRFCVVDHFFRLSRLIRILLMSTFFFSEKIISSLLSMELFSQSMFSGFQETLLELTIQKIESSSSKKYIELFVFVFLKV